jgi:acyl-CoA oxidase
VDIDAFNTLEGVNVLLSQQVAKELLTKYAKEMLGGGPVRGMLKYLGAEVNDFVFRADTRWNFLADNDVRKVDFYVTCLKFREGRLLRSLANRLKQLVKTDKSEPFEAWNTCLEHVDQLAEAHIERISVEQFLLSTDRCPSAKIRAVLCNLCDLYALWTLENHSAWFLEAGLFDASRTSQIKDTVRDLVEKVQPYLLDLVESWGFPDENIRSPLLYGNDGVSKHFML